MVLFPRVLKKICRNQDDERKIRDVKGMCYIYDQKLEKNPEIIVKSLIKNNTWEIADNLHDKKNNI